MKNSSKNLTYGALMAAFCCVLTRFLSFPSPVGYGYIHLGDVAVLLCGFIPGGWIGIFAAGIGSAIADIIGGYSIYALPTFLIKSIMAAIIFFVLKYKKPSSPIILLATIVAEFVMVLGYFLFELLIYGSALLSKGLYLIIVGNMIQGAFGVVAGYVFAIAFVKSKKFKIFRK